MKEKFKDWRPQETSLKVLQDCQTVLDRYRSLGYGLSLRQLYYQLVAKDLLPAQWADPKTGSTNNIRSYKRLGEVVKNGRLAGFIDWNQIEDRGRSASDPFCWDDPEEILSSAADSYTLDRWERTDKYIWVMAEKDAVSNIIEPVCRDYRVSFIANKGYTSASALYRLFHKARRAVNKGKSLHCIYCGDFDPSGVDMDRDINDRMNLFGEKYELPEFSVTRVALTMAQVEEYEPPPNPAKVTDKRAPAYVEKYGDESWELDALEPQVLERILRDTLEPFVDRDLWAEIDQEQDEMRSKMRRFVEGWTRYSEDEDETLGDDYEF